MFSVSLDEALEYRRHGQISKSYQAVCVTPDLATRLAGNLSAMLRDLLQEEVRAQARQERHAAKSQTGSGD